MLRAARAPSSCLSPQAGAPWSQTARWKPSPTGIWLHTPHGQQFPPSSPTSRVLTENSLHLLQPLPVRESTGANTRHGAASANIDRTGKATPGPALCSGLTVKSCPWTSRGAQAGRCQLRVGLTPVSGLVRPSRPIPVHATALLSTPPCSCSQVPRIGIRGWTPGASRKGEDALAKDQQHPQLPQAHRGLSSNAWELPGAELILGSDGVSPALSHCSAASSLASTDPTPAAPLQDPPVPHLPSESPKIGLGTPLVPRGDRGTAQTQEWSRSHSALREGLAPAAPLSPFL